MQRSTICYWSWPLERFGTLLETFETLDLCVRNLRMRAHCAYCTLNENEYAKNCLLVHSTLSRVERSMPVVAISVQGTTAIRAERLGPIPAL